MSSAAVDEENMLCRIAPANAWGAILQTCPDVSVKARNVRPDTKAKLWTIIVRWTFGVLDVCIMLSSLTQNLQPFCPKYKSCLCPPCPADRHSYVISQKLSDTYTPSYKLPALNPHSMTLLENSDHHASNAKDLVPSGLLPVHWLPSPSPAAICDDHADLLRRIESPFHHINSSTHVIERNAVIAIHDQSLLRSQLQVFLVASQQRSRTSASQRLSN